MEINLEKLQQLAETAGGLEWTYGGLLADYDGTRCQSINDEAGAAVICEFWPGEAQAKFIAAANPAVVLELVRRLKVGEQDGARYRWLRDRSEPGVCTFYLSVGAAFKGVKFARETVDEAIDAAMTDRPTVEDVPGQNGGAA